ncbi:MAG: cache domain-containing protein [Limnochordia bacterium]
MASNPDFDVAGFNVWDREWFQQVRTGRDTFSDPLLSGAGNMVVTVAAPVMDRGVFQGAVWGVVNLDALLTLVANQQVSCGGQSYLLSSNGEPITPVRGGKADRPLNTKAAVRIRQGGLGFARYNGPDGATGFWHVCPHTASGDGFVGGR